MKLTDYVANFLANEGIKYVFGLTGGAVVHIFDSLAKHPDIQPIFNHHEQAAAFAAEAYARVRNGTGAAVVTTGPGGTNAVTGVLAAWMDSVPCIYISGQSRIEHTSLGKPIRQLGSQEFDIVSFVSRITKYAVMVDDPQKIRYYLEKAAYIAKSGRPGPVWIDIPLNFQWASIEPEKLIGFDPLSEKKTSDQLIGGMVKKCLCLLCSAKRPLVLAGYGIRLSKAHEEFAKFLKELKIPFVSSWNASDLVPTEDPLYMGRVGMAGQRGGNLAIQNCDFLLALGSHLCLNITGANFAAFARDAKKVIVDIDPVELANLNIKVDLSIQSDVKIFLQTFLQHIFENKTKLNDISLWKQRCIKYKSYNAIPPEWKAQRQYVNPYVFVDKLSDLLEKDDVVVVDGGGTSLYMSFQGLKIKEGQRLIVSSGIASMGTGLPESVGACFANGRKRTICMTGDGSMQFNIQELQTIVHHKLPIKIFVFNNSGYLAIRHTQAGFLEGRYIGSSEQGGVSLPDFQKVAKAYGLTSIKINNRDLSSKLRKALQFPGPVLCEIMISPEQQLIPRMAFEKNPDGTASGKPLEDMAPLLDRKEFLENMVVKPWK